MSYNIGRWSIEEHILYLEGVLLFGRDLAKIQKHVGTRTYVQVRTHDQKVGTKKKKLVSKKKTALDILCETAINYKTPPTSPTPFSKV